MRMADALFAEAPRLPWCGFCGRRCRFGVMDHDVAEARLVMHVACHGERRTIYINQEVLRLLGLLGVHLPPEVYDPFPLPRLPAMLEAVKPPRKRGRALPDAPAGRLTVWLMPRSGKSVAGG